MPELDAILSSRPVIFSGVFIGSSLVMIWLLSIYSTYQNVMDRTQNNVIQIASLVLVTLFPFIGLIMYNLLKPGQTLEEARIQLLEEKILRMEFDKLVKERQGSSSATDAKPSTSERKKLSQADASLNEGK